MWQRVLAPPAFTRCLVSWVITVVPSGPTRCGSIGLTSTSFPARSGESADGVGGGADARAVVATAAPSALTGPDARGVPGGGVLTACAAAADRQDSKTAPATARRRSVRRRRRSNCAPISPSLTFGPL